MSQRRKILEGMTEDDASWVEWSKPVVNSVLPPDLAIPTGCLDHGTEFLS